MVKPTDFFSEHEAETKTEYKVRRFQLLGHTSTTKGFSYQKAKSMILLKPGQKYSKEMNKKIMHLI